MCTTNLELPNAINDQDGEDEDDENEDEEK